MELEEAGATTAARKALDSFIYGLPSPASQRQYLLRLSKFFRDIGLPGKTVEEQIQAFIDKVNDKAKKSKEEEEGTDWIEDTIIAFINHQKKRVESKSFSAGSLDSYVSTIKSFCDTNDKVIPAAKTINWKRIRRGLPPIKSRSNDRTPTIKEIQKLCEYPDRRIKPIVYVMCSSGIRIGAWDYLKWKHIIPMENGNGIAKIIVYGDEHDEHFSFITQEAYQSLKEWMDFRASYGEQITGESPLMRDLWQTSNVKYGTRLGLAKYPKPWRSESIERKLSQALMEQGIRQPLQNGKTRHEFKTAHGFRKFFKTRAEQVMKPMNVGLLYNHKNRGVEYAYWRPTEAELLEDYQKAATDLLTINDHKAALQKQVQELTEKSKEELYILKGQLAEKKREAEQAKKALAEFESRQQQFQEEFEKRQKHFEEEFAERMEEQRQTNLEIMQHEILRLNESRLKKIKNAKEREDEKAVLLMNAEVIDEYDIE